MRIRRLLSPTTTRVLEQTTLTGCTRGSILERRWQSTAQPEPQSVPPPPFPMNAGTGRGSGQRGQDISKFTNAVTEVERQFDPVYLRDCCTCSVCVNPSSRQKNFSTADIPQDISIASAEQTPFGLRLTWKTDIPGSPSDHATEIPHNLLQARTSNATHGNSTSYHLWDRASISKDLHEVSFEDYTTSPSALLSTLRALRRDGLVFLTSVPESPDSVVSIANAIGPLKSTFYGMTWDVRSVPQAKNVAYTSGHLGFHMDLLYMAQPPRLQFLHCLRSSAKGGKSLFTDSYRAVEMVRRGGDAEMWEALKGAKTTFQYDNDGHFYRQRRPTVELGEGGDEMAGGKLDIQAVNWSPPFQGPFEANDLGKGGIRAWHKVANRFRDIVEGDDAVYERQMSPGECVIFDNRRVLHARTAFEVGDMGKERWLKGAYLDWDPYASKLHVLENDHQ